VALFSYLLPSANKPEEVPLSEVIAMSQNRKIAEIRVEEDLLLVTTVDDTQVRAFKESNATIYEIEGLNLEGVIVDIKGSSGINWGGLLLNFLPLLIFGGLLFFLFRQARGANLSLIHISEPTRPY